VQHKRACMGPYILWLLFTCTISLELQLNEFIFEAEDRRHLMLFGEDKVAKAGYEGYYKYQEKRALRAEAAEASENLERVERAQRMGVAERGEGGERSERGERAVRADRGERGERDLRGEFGEIGERQERGERAVVEEKGERMEREARGERGEKGERRVRMATQKHEESEMNLIFEQRKERAERNWNALKTLQTESSPQLDEDTRSEVSVAGGESMWDQPDDDPAMWYSKNDAEVAVGESERHMKIRFTSYQRKLLHEILGKDGAEDLFNELYSTDVI